MLTSVDKNRLFALNTVSGVYSLIDRCIVWESIIQMKDEKATGLAGLVEEMAKPRGELSLHSSRPDGSDLNRGRLSSRVWAQHYHQLL